MSEIDLLKAALLMGVYVALAGSYGLTYTLARLYLRHAFALRRAAIALYGLHGLSAIMLVAFTPLQAGWKALIIASSAAFLVIPPLTWRFLLLTHEGEVS